ncbi:MAG: amidohydrolase family protein [Candidatus Latescibacteria bacterium]|nr:amidohydrolase family protein [Candidatus Latescibacterota bacterium]
MFTPEVSAQTSDFYDKILVNGHIITVDKSFRIAEAVAIRDGRFIAIGSNKAIESLADPNVEVIDLKGRTVVPGFIDGHAHMDREGLKFILPSLDGVRSIDDILEVIKQEVEKKKPGEWIATMPIGDYPNYPGGSDRLKEKRYPTRWDLDRVAPDNPVYIKGIWFYWSGKPPIVSIANSYALKLAGITRDTQGLHPGMTIVKEPESGEPNGIFEELGTIGTIEYSLMKIVPRFSHEQRVAALEYSMHQYNAAGTTSIYEGHGLAPAVIRAYKELWENKEMSVRSHLTVSPAWDAVPGAHPEMVLRDWAIYAGGRGLGDDMLKISGIYTAVGSSLQDNIRRKDSPYPG